MSLHSTDFFLFFSGVAISVCVIYQSITGKCAYKGKSARREENPPAFWFAMAFEELFAVSCISLGLNLGLLGEVTFGLFALTTLTMVIYAVGDATRRALKYPLRIFRFWYQGEFLDAAQELQTFLAKHPGDRETLYLLAGTYDRAGNHEAALDLYAEMVSMGGGWGRLVARAMVRSQEKF